MMWLQKIDQKASAEESSRAKNKEDFHIQGHGKGAGNSLTSRRKRQMIDFSVLILAMALKCLPPHLIAYQALSRLFLL